jgi:hypothetical protein
MERTVSDKHQNNPSAAPRLSHVELLCAAQLEALWLDKFK